MLTLEQEHDVYALRLAMCICGPVDAKTKLRIERKLRNKGVLSFYENARLEAAEEVAAVRNIT